MEPLGLPPLSEEEWKYKCWKLRGSVNYNNVWHTSKLAKSLLKD